jgi:hypothetical protein
MNGQRLRDEERLTRELRSLAAEMNQLAAPDSVETKVLEAFRARKVVTPFTVKRSNSYYWLAAIAAVLLIVMSVVALRWRSTIEAPGPTIVKEQLPDKPKNEVNTPQPGNEPQKEIEYRTVTEPPKRNQRKSIRPRVPGSENAQVANQVTEIATDFIPLRYMNAASLQDGGQIVRVELPRSALANFGLPVNMDRYNEKVKADVLFGVDGLAHAIRFVQ